MADQQQFSVVQPIPPGNPGIHQSVLLMLQLARTHAPRVEQEAHAIAARIPLAMRTTAVFAQAIHQWLLDHMVYTEDQPDVEEVRSPEWMLIQVDHYGEAHGDCDDYVTIGGALAIALGVPAKMRVVSQREDQEYDHVYLMFEIAPGRWMASDAIGGQPFGWSLRRAQITAQRDYPV